MSGTPPAPPQSPLARGAAPAPGGDDQVRLRRRLADLGHSTQRWASLVVVQGAESDIGTHVVCDRPVTLDVTPYVELPLNDGSISRRHCQIERDLESGRYLLSDSAPPTGRT